MLFGSLIEAAQNSPFKTPFATVDCQALGPIKNSEQQPALKEVCPQHKIMAAATVVEGGIPMKTYHKFCKF